ncbi:MAG: alkyl sulfatase dimerization domain-containing protein [Thermodesulfobacteriota bacterium]
MRKLLLLAGILLLALAAGAYFFLRPSHRVPGNKSLGNIGANADLSAHSRDFQQKVYQVTDRVYSAVGFGLANAILIKGDTGLIIVDTLESMEGAEKVMARFRQISDLPVAAIIYTHNHTDHILGARAFAGDVPPPVFAHSTLEGRFHRILGKFRPIIGQRSMRMFGNHLDQQGVVNAGIGPFLGIGENSTLGFLAPTQTFDDRLSVTVAGVSLTLIHAPGETDDQIYVWLPDQKVLCCGDNFYNSFPNLYTIRGTPYRSLESWYKSVDIMRDLAPEHLVPSHGPPVSGQETIGEILINYRDAIQYVHDQGIRAINKGLTPDEVVASVHLPPRLANLPYLQEYYGKVSWALRSLFSGNLGWFNGDGADLQPLSRTDRAKLWADVAGGPDALLAHARRRLDAKDFQAALELSGQVLLLSPDSRDAADIRIRAETALGSAEQNANARHYYLTEALELRDDFTAGRREAKASPDFLAELPLDLFFDSLAVNLDPEKSADLDQVVGIHFADTGDDFTVHVRRGVAEIRRGNLPENPDILVTADSLPFKQMLARAKNPVTTLAGFSYKTGNAVSFGKFMALFQPAEGKAPFRGER